MTTTQPPHARPASVSALVARDLVNAYAGRPVLDGLDLVTALHASPGTVVVASHDRWLRQRWTGRQLALT